MKKFYAILGILLLVVCIIFISCKKENTEPTPLDNTPVLTFLTGSEYVSSNVNLEVNSVFKVGVLGSKNPNTNIDLATFKVTRTFEGETQNVYENLAIDGPYLSWESNLGTQTAEGVETWTFTLQDYTGLIKTASIVITTVEQGSLSPIIIFIEGQDYTYEDVSLPPNTEFMVGINALSNSGTNTNLNTFRITRSGYNNPIIVFEESDIASNNFNWEGSLLSSFAMDYEYWTFSITDESGMTSDVSFKVTGQTPYIPAFSLTAVPYIVGGTEFISFVFTCTTDDYELTKVTVTAPGGLGTDTYDGLGQIFLQNEPATLTTDYPALPGTWALAITGIIKSGAHVNEAFISTATVTISD